MLLCHRCGLEHGKRDAHSLTLQPFALLLYRLAPSAGGTQRRTIPTLFTDDEQMLKGNFAASSGQQAVGFGSRGLELKNRWCLTKMIVETRIRLPSTRFNVPTTEDPRQKHTHKKNISPSLSRQYRGRSPTTSPLPAREDPILVALHIAPSGRGQGFSELLKAHNDVGGGKRKK